MRKKTPPQFKVVRSGKKYQIVKKDNLKRARLIDSKTTCERICKMLNGEFRFEG
tara:strand:+ start:110 stop:271 length:162 start_codon:yes stop_codon:yes gene_type:complete